MITLGQTYKDQITGFTGVATGRTVYISGCTQVLLAGEVQKDGKLSEGEWFDEQRLQPVGSKVIRLENGATPGCDQQAPKR